MRIAIDVSAIIYGTGVSVYTKNLIENLYKLDKENEYILFGGSLRRFNELKNKVLHLSDIVDENKERTSERLFPIPPTVADLIWNRLHVLRIEKLVGKNDVFHSSDWTQPPSSSFKVTTIHDLVPLKFPELSDPKLVSVHTARLKWVCKEVDRVIVPSVATSRDVEGLGIKKERIRIIPEAPNPSIVPVGEEEVEKLKKKYRISGKYLLAVGVNPRKNTQRIIDAFEKIKTEVKSKLIIIGHRYSDITPSSGVFFLGHIPGDELPTFYSGAEVLVYPSLYEGFGIPILEAFVCETPVVTSNVGSMAEVAGNAAVLVDPYNTSSIADGILEAVKNKDKLVKSGLKQAKKFSWEKTARETLKVYKEG